MVKLENDPREHARLLVAGIAYVTAMVIGISLCIAIYNKTFESVTKVTLEADRAGLQLARYGDVRYNGVLVGSVRKIDQKGDRAVITLGVDNEDAKRIPRDVGASIIPTTLFGQKYIAFTEPTTGGPLGLEDGTVIGRDRVQTSVELNKVLKNLNPLLNAVRPQDLNMTLSALANAFDGRGEAIGSSLEKLDGYLAAINVEVPTLRDDIRLLADVANAYDLAAPDLIQALGNLSVTGRTIRIERDSVEGLFADLRDTANVGADLMEANEQRIYRELELATPMARLLNKYAPQYECLLRGVAVYKPLLLQTFENGRVKQFIEFPAPQVRPYDARDRPAYNDKRGPRCAGLPNNAQVPWPGYPTDNGTDLDTQAGRGTSFQPGGTPRAVPANAMAQNLTMGAFAVYSGNDSVTRREAAAVAARRLDLDAGQVGSFAEFMYTPMIQGGLL